MNGHFIGFRQLVQKLERITPIISTLQDKQNEWIDILVIGFDN